MAASQALSTDDRVRVAGQEPIPQGCWWRHPLWYLFGGRAVIFILEVVITSSTYSNSKYININKPLTNASTVQYC